MNKINLNAITIDNLMKEAAKNHQSGKLAEAEINYRNIIAIDPQHTDSYHLLGVLAFQVGRFDLAVTFIQQALAQRENVVEYHCNLGEALRRLGRFDEALHHLHRAHKITPNEPNPIINLGALLDDMGQFSEAEVWMKKAVALVPNHAGAHCNLGMTLKKLGRINDARLCLEKAVTCDPSYLDALHQLGVIHQDSGDLENSATWYQKALSVKANDVETINNLGAIKLAQGQVIEAEFLFKKALALQPNQAVILTNLGSTLNRIGNFHSAIPLLQQALTVNANSTKTLCSLANALNGIGENVQAEQIYLRGLQIEPTNSQANLLYAIFLQRQKRLIEAVNYATVASQNGDKRSKAVGTSQLMIIEAYLSNYQRVKTLSDEAITACPTDPIICAQRLYAFSYHPDLPVSDILAEFSRWGDNQKTVHSKTYSNKINSTRRLKVGFVSPDFRGHTSRFYFAPLLENYDRDQIEFIAYSNVLKPDDWTVQFQDWVDGWRNIRGLSDEAAAQQIMSDGIDILIDGCNHMEDHRLGVFALKPAPIQVTWLGAAWTTGLPTVDYVLFDPHLAPEGTLAREKIIRLPGCFVAYRPPPDRGDVAALPALRNGFITFGYSGRTERLNYRTFQAWGEILKRLPTAHLILDYGPFAHLPTQTYYRELLGKYGVDVSRVEMRNSSNIFAGLGDIDILLDCFPHSGGTMLFDALWMGVPALTLASRPPLGRIGTSLMMNLDLPEWVTHSEEEYITQAVKFAQDIPNLVEIRAGMRERMRNSPLMDEQSFTRAYEMALRGMWQTWCEEVQ